MKRKLALALAGVMALSTLPMNVFAASTNSISGTTKITDSNTLFVPNGIDNDYLTTTDSSVNTYRESPEVEIQFDSTMKKDTYFDVYVENGTFAFDADEDETGLDSSDAWINFKADLEVELPDGSKVAANTLFDIKLSSDGERITFTALSDIEDDSELVIPIYAYVEDEDDDLLVGIDGGNSVVTDTEFTAATATEGNTYVTIKGADTSRKETTFDFIMTEEVEGTFGDGDLITLSLPSGFTFESNDDAVSDFYYGSDSDIKVTINDDDNSRKMYIQLPEDFDSNGSDTNLQAVKVPNIKVVADSDNDDYGEDITMDVEGTNDITDIDDVVIGYYTDWTVSANLTENDDDVPVLWDGRYAATAVNSEDKDTDGYDDDGDIVEISPGSDFEDYHETATMTFEEAVSESWWSERETEFTAPEGMRIMGFELDNIENVSSVEEDSTATNTFDEKRYVIGDEDSTEEDNSWLSWDDDFNMVTFDSLYVSEDEDDYASFDITFYVAAEADTAGDSTDVAISVGGSAVPDEIDAVTVAEMKTPYTVETSVTNVEVGYQSYNTADIDITENEDDEARFLETEDILLKLDYKDTAGGDGLIFNDADVMTAEGDLVIDDIDTDDEVITIDLDDESSSDSPSTITVTNVNVGLDRTVPETNSEPFTVKVSTESNNAEEETIRYGNYERDYINVATAGEGSVNDTVVAVTVGDTNIMVNGEEMDMAYDNGQMAEPFIDPATDSLMVPVRFVSEAFGYEVAWGQSNQTVTIFIDSTTTVQFPVGEDYYISRNGQEIANSYAAVTQNIVDPSTGLGTVYVPFRTVGYALGIPSDEVYYDADTETAYYNYNPDMDLEADAE